MSNYKFQIKNERQKNGRWPFFNLKFVIFNLKLTKMGSLLRELRNADDYQSNVQSIPPDQSLLLW